MGSNTYTTSSLALTQIATKYDESSINYKVTHPQTGASGFVLDLRKNWKTYTSSASSMNALYLQRLMYKDSVYKSMSDLRAASIKAKDSSYLDSASKSLDTVRDFSSQARTLRNNIYDYAGNGDKVVTAIEIGFTVYYSIVIACAVGMIVTVIFIGCCGCYKWRCISQIGWCILAFFMVIGFLFGALVFPVSVVLVEGCDIIKLSNLEQDRGIIPQNVWKEANTCLVGNGDLYTKYNLDTKIDFAKQITDAFALVDAFYDSANDTLRYNISDAFVQQVPVSQFPL